MNSTAVTALRTSATFLVTATTTPLPGDELLSDVEVTTTRGITIDADAAATWPWIAQIGQGRGDFYSYDVLENLVGADIHNADEVIPAWQSVHVGDPFLLHPNVALTVALVDPGRALVVRGGVPMGRMPAPYDFTWAFVLRPSPDGTTRLVVRERYSYSKRWAVLVVQPAQLVSSLMSLRMLRGIAQRAEDATALHDPSEVVASASRPAGGAQLVVQGRDARRPTRCFQQPRASPGSPGTGLRHETTGPWLLGCDLCTQLLAPAARSLLLAGGQRASRARDPEARRRSSGGEAHPT